MDQVDLGEAERLVLCLAGLEVLVEALHQLAGRLVLDLPERSEDRACSGILESPRQADQPLAAHLLAEPRLAGGERDEVCVDPDFGLLLYGG